MVGSFIHNLHRMNVAGVVDDLLSMLATDRPSDPLKTMHDGIACSFASSLPAGYDVRDPSQEKRVRDREPAGGAAPGAGAAGTRSCCLTSMVAPSSST
ncbi:hypothetical protein DIPPA_10505 [Diplonema papillatum]|nr:hypothetical protein DIPPA_10505 [Diplonema papillatum]